MNLLQAPLPQTPMTRSLIFRYTPAPPKVSHPFSKSNLRVIATTWLLFWGSLLRIICVIWRNSAHTRLIHWGSKWVQCQRWGLARESHAQDWFLAHPVVRRGYVLGKHSALFRPQAEMNKPQRGDDFPFEEILVGSEGKGDQLQILPARAECSQNGPLVG